MASKLFDLTGKTAVVVGGTSGIGLAIALGLADSGAMLWRRAGGWSSAKRRLRRLRPRA